MNIEYLCGQQTVDACPSWDWRLRPETNCLRCGVDDDNGSPKCLQPVCGMPNSNIAALLREYLGYTGGEHADLYDPRHQRIWLSAVNLTIWVFVLNRVYSWYLLHCRMPSHFGKGLGATIQSQDGRQRGVSIRAADAFRSAR